MPPSTPSPNCSAYLPDNVDEEPVRWPSDDPPDRSCPEAGDLIPPISTGSYDVRHVAAAIVDADSLFEVRDRWAPNVVTAFATLDGRPLGIVANQPLALAGTLDIPASQKAARFVALCDAFNLPILTLVDTPGFYPGKDLEWRGMIRHGAQLVFAYARATVPRLCVILRKSYGGAYIVMDSKRMGNDLCVAWPWAELAVMGAGQAAAILQRRATPEERAAFEADYAERLLNPYVAAERGFIDAVIDPADTRRQLCGALETLADEARAPRPPQTRERAAVMAGFLELFGEAVRIWPSHRIVRESGHATRSRVQYGPGFSRKRRGVSTSIVSICSSVTPASRSIGQDVLADVQVVPVRHRRRRDLTGDPVEVAGRVVAQHHPVGVAAAAQLGDHLDPLVRRQEAVDAEAVHAEDRTVGDQLLEVAEVVGVAAVADDDAAQVDALLLEDRLLLEPAPSRRRTCAS